MDVNQVHYIFGPFHINIVLVPIVMDAVLLVDTLLHCTFASVLFHVAKHSNEPKYINTNHVRAAKGRQRIFFFQDSFFVPNFIVQTHLASTVSSVEH